MTASGSSLVQVIICGEDKRRLTNDGRDCIQVTALAKRSAKEREHIVWEYAADALGEFEGKRSLNGSDRAWILKNRGGSHSEILKASRRLLALRLTGNVHRASQMLDISYPTLSRWFKEKPPEGMSAEDSASSEALDEELDA